MRIGKKGLRKVKASFANIALFLSIFVVLFPLASPTVSADEIYERIIYVDDDATGFQNGSKEYPYETISDALIDASGEEYDVLIRVYEGTYNETLSISSGDWDTLTLEGNHSSNTTIDAQGTGTVITISASWVNVTGFTINNRKNDNIPMDQKPLYF